MGKEEKTIYTCDRCGCVISEGREFGIRRFKYINFLKWWGPIPCKYDSTYLCRDCWEKIVEVMENKDD